MNLNQKRQKELTELRYRGDVLADSVRLLSEQMNQAYILEHPFRENLDRIETIHQILYEQSAARYVKESEHYLRSAVDQLARALDALDKAEAAMAPAGEGGNHEEAY